VLPLALVEVVFLTAGLLKLIVDRLRTDRFSARPVCGDRFEKISF
jgi:hypothetical protein